MLFWNKGAAALLVFAVVLARLHDYGARRDAGGKVVHFNQGRQNVPIYRFFASEVRRPYPLVRCRAESMQRDGRAVHFNQGCLKVPICRHFSSSPHEAVPVVRRQGLSQKKGSKVVLSSDRLFATVKGRPNQSHK